MALLGRDISVQPSVRCTRRHDPSPVGLLVQNPSVPSSSWLDQQTTHLAAQLSEFGLSIAGEQGSVLITERLETVAKLMRISPHHARSYFDPLILAVSLAASLSDELPGKGLLDQPRDVAIPIELTGRATASFVEAIQVRITPEVTTHGLFLVRSSCGSRVSCQPRRALSKTAPPRAPWPVTDRLAHTTWRRRSASRQSHQWTPRPSAMTGRAGLGVLVNKMHTLTERVTLDMSSGMRVRDVADLPKRCRHDDGYVNHGYAVMIGGPGTPEQWFYFNAAEPAYAFGRTARMSAQTTQWAMYPAAWKRVFDQRRGADVTTLHVVTSQPMRNEMDDTTTLRRFTDGVTPNATHWLPQPQALTRSRRRSSGVSRH